MFKHYIKSALRNIFKNRASAIIAIFGLAAGIICFSFCMYYVREMKAVNNGYRDSERIVTFKTGKNGLYEFQTYPAFSSDLEKLNLFEIESVASVYCFGNTFVNYYKNDGTKKIYNTCKIEADTSLIDILGLRTLDGDLKDAKNITNSIIITQSLAKRIYGDESAINKDVTWGMSKEFYTIRAVIEDFPDNISIDKVKPEFIIPEQTGILYNSGIEDGLYADIECIAKLKNGFDSKDINRKFEELGFYQNNNGDIYNFQAVDYVGIIKTENDIYIFLLLTGGLILLISLLNYIIFVSGIAKNRYQEYHLRTILGSTPSSLFILIASEVIITILLSGITTFILTEIISKRINITISDQRIIFEISQRILFLQEIFYIACIVVMSLFATFFFVKRLFGENFKIEAKTRSCIFRNSMLYIQFFICFIFISGAVLIYRQSLLTDKTIYNNFTDEEKENIFYINLIKFDFENERSQVINKLRNNPGIEDILFVESKFSESRFIMMKINDNIEQCKYYNVSDNFFRFTNQEIPSDKSYMDTEGVYFTSSYNIEDLPVSVSINFQDEDYKVLGVFDNRLHSIILDKAARYNLIFVKPQKGFDNINFGTGFSNMYIKCNSEFKGEHKSEIRRILQPLYSEDFIPEIITLKEEYENLCWKEIYLRKLLFIFSLISLIITLAGVYSTIKNDTEKRRKEVTIRKINGASYFNIAMIFCRNYLWFIIVAAITAFPLVWIIADDFLSEYHIKIDINNPLFWISVFLMIILFVFLTMFIKVRNIVKLDPCKGLRNE